MRVAGEVARQLYESGRELRSRSRRHAARVEVLLCDVDGIVLSRLTPSRVLEIATGSPAAMGADLLVVKPSEVDRVLDAAGKALA